MSHVLIVDDKEENRYILRLLLQGSGYTTDEACHGAEALIKAGQQLPDLVISDLLMPVMDGYTLLRRWKTDDRLRAVPFIVYTATYTDQRDERLAMDLGADAFILKPAEPDVFLAKVKEILRLDLDGELSSSQPPPSNENLLLRQYNEVLVRKLEEKVNLLEQTNDSLMEEVAQHRRSQAELRRASQLLTAVTEGSPDAIFVKDSDGRYLLCNPAAAAYMGRRQDEVIGRHDREFFDAASAAQVEQNDQRVIAENATFTREEVLTAAGATRTYHATKAPYRGMNGEVLGVIGISRDISDRKAAEERLREREALLALLLDSTVEGIYGIDREGRCTFANRACAALLGYPGPESLAGIDPFAPMCVDDSCRSSYYGALRDVQSLYLPDEVFRRADDSTFVGDLHVHPLNREGEHVGAVVTLRDVTQRKKLEEQLHQAQRMEAIGRLAGGVAHDFNNLLAVIIGYADFAIENLPESLPAHDDVRQIRLAADKAAALTRQLLAFSRRQVLKPEIIEINYVFEEAQSLLRRLLGEDVLLEFRLAPDLGRVKADVSQIEQVLMHLVVNARDAMPRGGTVTIKTENLTLAGDYVVPRGRVQPGNYVCFTVADTGTGMDPDTIARIFEPFFTTKESGKGTGLGLATVYGIVEQSGGHISVYSEPGQGTVFKVLLPRVDEASPARTTKLDAKRLGGSETILLVEDDPALRTLTTRVLEAAGYTVIAAEDGRDALAQSQGHAGEIALLLTDVVMPHLSGRELAEQIAMERPRIKVLYMSGFTEDAIVRHGISHDTIEFIGKPFSAQQLSERVREVLDKAQPVS